MESQVCRWWLSALRLTHRLHRVLVFISSWVQKLPSNWALQSMVSLPSLQLQRVSAWPSFISIDLTFSWLSDKAGRSVPAPGRGALTVAREIQSKHPLRILDVAYRSRQMAFHRNQISDWLRHKHNQLQEEIEKIAKSRRRQVVKKNMLSQCMGCCKVQILLQSVITGIIPRNCNSEYVPKLMTSCIMLISSKQHRRQFSGPSILDVPI